MGAIKPGPQGERAISVNTIARGMPDDPAEPVVPSPCFFIARGPWVRPSPGIPCALFMTRVRNAASLGRLGAARTRAVGLQLFDMLNRNAHWRVICRRRPGQASVRRVAPRRARRSGTHNHRRLLREGRRRDRLAQQLRALVMGPRSSAQLRTRRGRQWLLDSHRALDASHITGILLD
jgi:hypothetical protein